MWCGRYTGRGVEQDDLYQLGCIGFLKAIQGFDPAFGTQFSTYAVPKIAGEMRRFLRDDGTVKVSRTLRERAARIAQARSELTAAMGGEPTVSELAEYLELEPEEIAMAGERHHGGGLPLGGDRGRAHPGVGGWGTRGWKRSWWNTWI